MQDYVFERILSEERMLSHQRITNKWTLNHCYHQMEVTPYRTDRLGEVQLLVLTRCTLYSIPCSPAEPAADPCPVQPVPGHLLTEHLQEKQTWKMIFGCRYHIGISRLKLCSEPAKANTKANIFFDVCRLLLPANEVW